MLDRAALSPATFQPHGGREAFVARDYSGITQALQCQAPSAGPGTGRQLAMLAMPDPNYQEITVDLFPALCKILDLQRENGSHPL
jgi:hypothetical protein